MNVTIDRAAHRLPVPLHLLLPLLFSGLVSCRASDHLVAADHDQHEEAAAPHAEGVVALSPEKLARIELEIAPAERAYLPSVVETTGEVGYEEDRLAHVTPRIPGRVQKVAARLGDEVRPGQVLAIIDSVELGRAKADYLTARVREEVSQENRERERKLFADRISSQREMLEAEGEHRQAVSERERAEETLRLYGVDGRELASLRAGDPGASLLPIRAPLGGRVVEKHATLGELVTPERILFTIADLAHLWIWIDVYERDLATVHLGDSVSVSVEAFPGAVFAGEVTFVGAEVASATRTLRARIDVANPDGRLHPGMFASIQVTDPHAEGDEPTLLVPESAVQRFGETAVVFSPLTTSSADSGRFRVRPVEVGRRASGLVEILSGLEPGEPVVFEGTFFLKSELAREELGGGHDH